MLKQRLKADVTEQEIPCGLSKDQGYLWKPEKMVTSLGNFKWNVQFCLLKGLLFFWFFFSSCHKKNLQGFFSVSRSCGGDLLQYSLREEGMEISGIGVSSAAHTSGVSRIPWSCCFPWAHPSQPWAPKPQGSPAAPTGLKQTQFGF